ncbi:hypothetical protein [Thioalkalivibrio sp. ALMg9]|uniref:hypothetical protein n=1 Tax=Thioalkalivibrio sp. ALMg9 TaxID=1266912 RepID=UPI00035F1724|nr:hypothetical protein [Thioalkalivibrio sp. ALMg9]
MGFILTLILAALAIFLSAGLVTAVRRHGWTVGVRRYGAALVGLGLGVGHAVARPALDGQEAAGASSQDATVADILGDMMVPAETPGFEGGDVLPDPYSDENVEIEALDGRTYIGAVGPGREAPDDSWTQLGWKHHR